VTDIDPKFQQAIRRMTERIKELSPELGELVATEQILAGSEAEHMARIMEMVTANPELAEQVEKIAAEEFHSIRAQSLDTPEAREAVQALKKMPDRQDAISEFGMTEEDLVFWPKGTLLPQLHPLVQAAIAERLQFDDDIPELRTGSLPPDAMPAVPVDTTARSPVAIGAQLDQAAQEVRQELDDAQADKALQVETLHKQLASEPEREAWDSAAGALVKQADVKQEITRVTEGRVGVEGYEAGKAPALRKVEPANLATISDEDKQRYAFKTLASTQGRKSAVPVIGSLIEKDLSALGYDVETAAWTRGVSPIAEAEWAAQIDGGKEGTQANFSSIDVAAKVIGKHLHQRLAGREGKIVLQVRPVNTVQDRRVGWMAQVIATQ